MQNRLCSFLKNSSLEFDFRILGAIAFGGGMIFDDVNLDNPFNGDSISIKGGGLVYAIALPSSSGFEKVWPYE